MGFIWGVPGLGLLENGLPLMMRSVDEEVAAKLDIQASLAKGAMMSLISIFEQEDEILRKEITQKYNRYIKDIAENIEKIRKIHKKYNKDVRYLHYAAGQVDNLQDSFHIALTKMGLTEDEFLAIGKDGIKAFYENIPKQVKRGSWYALSPPGNRTLLSYLVCLIALHQYPVAPRANLSCGSWRARPLQRSHNAGA